MPTYCYGETQGAAMGRTYTKAQCDELLLRRLDEFAGKVEHCIKAPMSDRTLVAFTSFAYNVGSGGAWRVHRVPPLQRRGPGGRVPRARLLEQGGRARNPGPDGAPGSRDEALPRGPEVTLLAILQNGWTAFSLVSLLTGAVGSV